MKLTDKMLLGNKLAEYNSLAIDALMGMQIEDTTTSSLTSAGTEIASDIKTAFFKSIEYITEMAETCFSLDPGASRNDILGKLEKIEQDSIDTIVSTTLAQELDYAQSQMVNSINANLYQRVKRLSPALRDSASDEFTLDNVQTLHDMIRYLHQMGVKYTFDMSYIDKADSNLFKQINLGSGGRMEIIDVEKQLPEGTKLKPTDTKNIFVTKVAELYSKLDKYGSETFRGILMAKKFMTQVHMGCHYAEIQASVGNSNSVEFYFRDTPTEDYKNAPHRTKYVVNVLTKMGFEVTTKKAETRAVWKGKNSETTAEKFKEVVRLAASTKDLDLNGSYINKYGNKSVNAFFSGTTNLRSYLSTCYDRGEKDDSKIN